MPDVAQRRALTRLRKLDTIDSPKFLGLSGPKGGVGRRPAAPNKAGKNVVVGVVDTGIWPENPSFAGDPQACPTSRASTVSARRVIAGSRTTCNSKIISARYFVKGFGVHNLSADEYVSPRDGSRPRLAHRLDGSRQPRRPRPHRGSRTSARPPAWRRQPTSLSTRSAGKLPTRQTPVATPATRVAAINKAVQDGVDVINYSISGTRDDFADPVELAFLGAAAGGIFVAASAGNSGPTPSTVAHPSPWVATVAASTHHVFQGSVVLGNGKSYVGAMISDDEVSKRRIVLSADAGKRGADPAEVALCYLGTLEPDARSTEPDRGL
ncbi:MAG: S8 family serine peptidase [Nocardioidaceae bacterium]